MTRNKDEKLFVTIPVAPTEAELKELSEQLGRTPEELRSMVDLCDFMASEFEQRQTHPSEALSALVSMAAIAISKAPKQLHADLCQRVFETLWQSAGLPRA
jgi:hypothetical protein